MDLRDGVTTSSKEQMRSLVRVQVQGEITPKSGKDQGATTKYPRGLKCKDWTSREKTPYLECGDDVAKVIQLKGFKSKMTRGPTWKKRRRQAGPPHFCVGSASHFLSVKMLQP
jgi:hypothetical protein